MIEAFEEKYPNIKINVEYGSQNVDEYLQMNEGQPNPYFELKLYRTRLHYRLNILYDTLLCDKEGRLVPEIILAKFRRYCMIKYSKSIVMMKGKPLCSSYSHPH